MEIEVIKIDYSNPTKQKKSPYKDGLIYFGRGGKIRTCDLLVPNEAR